MKTIHILKSLLLLYMFNNIIHELIDGNVDKNSGSTNVLHFGALFFIYFRMLYVLLQESNQTICEFIYFADA